MPQRRRLPHHRLRLPYQYQSDPESLESGNDNDEPVADFGTGAAVGADFGADVWVKSDAGEEAEIEIQAAIEAVDDIAALDVVGADHY